MASDRCCCRCHLWPDLDTLLHPCSHTHAITNTQTDTPLLWRYGSHYAWQHSSQKSPQGINNRPGPETTNTISGLHWRVPVSVCVCVSSFCVNLRSQNYSYRWMISPWKCTLLWLCFCFHFACAKSILFFARCEQQTLLFFHPTGLLWPHRICWRWHRNPHKTFTPKENK